MLRLLAVLAIPLTLALAACDAPPGDAPPPPPPATDPAPLQ